MKIAILIDEYAPGAMPKIARNEKSEMIKLGHEVDIVVCTKFGELPEDFIYPFPKWVSYIKRRVPGFSFFSYQHLLNYFCAKKMKGYDLIIAHGMFAGAIGIRSNIKTNLICWDPFSTMINKIYSKSNKRHWLKVCEQLDINIIKEANRSIIPSTYHAKWFIDRNLKYEIVYPGCNPFNTNKERTMTLLMVDRWDIGSQPVLNCGSKIPIIVAGKWKWGKERFEKKLKEHEIDKYYSIIGEVTEEKLNELYDTCHMLIHDGPESFGMTGLEAAARGCSIQFLHKSGVNDIIPNQLSGPDSYTRAMEYTWERHVKELLK